ncbi:MAG: arylesterase [Alphaproteobacteria bacterium]|jgi:acyl-CoA thioesterase-1|nr:arylesterase [Alphaproteobacteria bacterium]
MASLFRKLGTALPCGALALALNLWAPATAATDCRIAFLGDSLTAGYGLEEEESWPAEMRDRLAAAGYPCTVVNAGLSGDTTAGGRARLDWLLADDPSHVVLALGANDGLRAVPVTEMKANLEAMLETLAEADVPTLLAGMRAPPNMGEDYAERFEAAFRDLAERFDVAFYPFLLKGVAARPELNQPDGIHPNAAGVEVMVENIWPTFEEWLRETGVTPG